MVEKIGGLLGLVVVCAVAATAIVLAVRLIAGEAADELLPAGPGDEISSGDDDWLVDSPGRTLVDLDELRRAVLDLEAMLRTAIDEEFTVGYRAIRHPGSGALIGVRGEAVLVEPPDPARFAEAGFDPAETPSFRTTAPTYPAAGPEPEIADPPPPASEPLYPTASGPAPRYPTTPQAALVLAARTGTVWVTIAEVRGEYHIHFSVILDFEDE